MALPADNKFRLEYIAKRKLANTNWHRMVFDMMPGWSEAREQSPDDVGSEPDPIEWNHLSGYVRLGGARGKEQWWSRLWHTEQYGWLKDVNLFPVPFSVSVLVSTLQCD